MSPAALRETVEALAALGTRDTNLPGCEAGLTYLSDRLTKKGYQVLSHEYDLFAGPRVPVARRARQIWAVTPGDGKLLLLAAHVDSYSTAGIGEPAPGANDDGSGCAAVLACAEALAGLDGPRRVGFAFFTGEEQGLVGSRAFATDHGHDVAALIALDMVGNSRDLLGRTRDAEVRVFSAPGPSRELARAFELLARPRARLVLREDRLNRGGDHTPFERAGVPAIRLTEAAEVHARQHTPADLADAMDFDYLAHNTQAVHAFALGWLMARADPTEVSAMRDRMDTNVRWTGDVNARVLYRLTTESVWSVGEERLGDVELDDHEFAVQGPGGVPVIPSLPRTRF